jgi:hypothetical protein
MRKAGQRPGDERIHMEVFESAERTAAMGKLPDFWTYILTVGALSFGRLNDRLLDTIGRSRNADLMDEKKAMSDPRSAPCNIKASSSICRPEDSAGECAAQSRHRRQQFTAGGNNG